MLLAFSVLLIVSEPDASRSRRGCRRRFLGRGCCSALPIGGFWTMSAAVAMRLVPPALVPRALSMIFSGVSAATILAAPVGSYLGDIIGWRNVFLIATALGVVTLVTQVVDAAQPGAERREPPAHPGRGADTAWSRAWHARRDAGVHRPLPRSSLYIRPFLETVVVGISVVSAILLGFGVANFLGTVLAGRLLERSLRLTLIAMPLLMGILGLGFVAPVNAAADAVMVVLWGLAFGAVPVAWSTWLTRTVPDQAESAGGLLVAAVQLAITIGAAAGGMLFDISGITGVFTRKRSGAAAGGTDHCGRCPAAALIRCSLSQPQPERAPYPVEHHQARSPCATARLMIVQLFKPAAPGRAACPGARR